MYRYYYKKNAILEKDCDDFLKSCETMNFSAGQAGKAKAWKDIWGSGQGIGAVKARESAGEYVAKLVGEYNAAKARIL